MIDRICFTVFAALVTLAFVLGVWSVGSELIAEPSPAPRVVQLETVYIVGHRASAPVARADAVQPAEQRVQ